MGDISLEMIWKRLEELQAGQAALHADLRDVRSELAILNDKVEGMAQTIIGIRRDVRSLQSEVATLSTAVDGHTHRLERIEKKLDLTHA
jgi:predicted RNase H-like nuclease (RuvC/YqgF family)